MRIRKIYACLWCGLRPGAVRSAFCARDAKRLGFKLIDQKHRTHWFQTARHGYEVYGKSILDSIFNP